MSLTYTKAINDNPINTWCNNNTTFSQIGSFWYTQIRDYTNKRNIKTLLALPSSIDVINQFNNVKANLINDADNIFAMNYIVTLDANNVAVGDDDAVYVALYNIYRYDCTNVPIVIDTVSGCYNPANENQIVYNVKNFNNLSSETTVSYFNGILRFADTTLANIKDTFFDTISHKYKFIINGYWERGLRSEIVSKNTTLLGLDYIPCGTETKLAGEYIKGGNVNISMFEKLLNVHYGCRVVQLDTNHTVSKIYSTLESELETRTVPSSLCKLNMNTYASYITLTDNTTNIDSKISTQSNLNYTANCAVGDTFYKDEYYLLDKVITVENVDAVTNWDSLVVNEDNATTTTLSNVTDYGINGAHLGLDTAINIDNTTRDFVINQDKDRYLTLRTINSDDVVYVKAVSQTVGTSTTPIIVFNISKCDSAVETNNMYMTLNNGNVVGVTRLGDNIYALNSTILETEVDSTTVVPYLDYFAVFDTSFTITDYMVQTLVNTTSSTLGLSQTLEDITFVSDSYFSVYGDDSTHTYGSDIMNNILAIDPMYTVTQSTLLDLFKDMVLRYTSLIITIDLYHLLQMRNGNNANTITVDTNTTDNDVTINMQPSAAAINAEVLGVINLIKKFLPTGYTPVYRIKVSNNYFIDYIQFKNLICQTQ